MSRVKGYGNGITQDVLSIFRTNGAAFGSGLCERGRELRPHLDIQSNSTDTPVTLSVPLVAGRVYDSTLGSYRQHPGN
jgi:hypothetical protein